MTTSEFIQESFLIKSTFANFQDWLESWRMSNGKDDYWNVSWMNFAGEFSLSWHAPNDLQKPAEISEISFKVIPRDVELIDVTACYANDPDIIHYINPLLKHIKQRWASQDPEPDFSSLIDDPALLELLKARWRESQQTLKTGAYLSTIILLGSILEGMLSHKIQSNPQQAGTAKSAPKDRGNNVRPFSDWSLDAMIAVARECGWLDIDVHGYTVALRGYRNLVHPREQIKNGIYPDEDTCLMSLPIIKAALSDLTRKV